MRRTLFKKSLLISQLATLFVINAVVHVTSANAQQICGSSNSSSHGERPSETRRTVELADFSVAVSIPDNYRTMRLQNGAVHILHPSAFDMLQCSARGGRGGHGYYFESLESVKDDLTIDLEEQAIRLGGYNQGRNDGNFSTTQVIPYEQGKLKGYIVKGRAGFGVSFLGVIPRRNELLKASVGCDCQVEIEDLTELLSNITVMN